MSRLLDQIMVQRQLSTPKVDVRPEVQILFQERRPNFVGYLIQVMDFLI